MIFSIIQKWKAKVNVFKMFFFENIFHFFPLQNKILFGNFFGKGLGDDPKYILNAIQKRTSHPKLMWIVNSKKNDLPNGVFPVKYGTIRYIYHLCTAKVWVFNIKSLWKNRKRSGQYYVQTWHSTLAIKKVERAVEQSLGKYAEISKQDSKLIDLMYTNNNFRKSIFERDFWYSGCVQKTDVPRCSILIKPPMGLKSIVCQKLHVPEEKSIALYAPTFRKTSDVSIFVWEYQKIITCLEKKFNKAFIMLVRLHPNITALASKVPYSECVIDANNFPDMQELLAVSDILLNDYSSTMFEFGYMRKPVFLFAPDVDEYLQNDRGLEFSFDELPFPLDKTIDKVCERIRQFNQSEYQKKCDTFYKKIGMVDSGCGAEIIADTIMKNIN